MGCDKKQTEHIGRAIEQLINNLEQLKGQTITIKEYLTSDESTYDRHFTSFSYFNLSVEQIGMRFSGARVWIEGFDENQGVMSDKTTGIKIVKPSAYYEISGLNLREVLFSNHTIILIEVLSDKWVRKTEIDF